MTEQELFEKHYVEVDASAPGFRWNGQKLHVPGSYSAATATHCMMNIGKFKVFALRQWSGNGFGHDSTQYVVNVDNDKIYRMCTDHFTYRQHIAFLKELVQG